jgi:hypothetical protein
MTINRGCSNLRRMQADVPAWKAVGHGSGGGEKAQNAQNNPNKAGLETRAAFILRFLRLFAAKNFMGEG